MISPEKRQANRDNARKSTGPKTPEGKARSARNADANNAMLLQERGAELLMRGAELVPPEGRPKFWREQVDKDLTLRELLKNADVARLARSHGW